MPLISTKKTDIIFGWVLAIFMIIGVGLTAGDRTNDTTWIFAIIFQVFVLVAFAFMFYRLYKDGYPWRTSDRAAQTA